jgi:hypothetical protein
MRALYAVCLPICPVRGPRVARTDLPPAELHLAGDDDANRLCCVDRSGAALRPGRARGRGYRQRARSVNATRTRSWTGNAILQVRGRFLDAVYIIQRRSPTSQDIGAAALLAITTGNRLLAST